MMTNWHRDAVRACLALEDMRDGRVIAAAVRQLLAANADPYLVAGMLEGWVLGWRAASRRGVKRPTDAEMEASGVVSISAWHVRYEADRLKREADDAAA